MNMGIIGQSYPKLTQLPNPLMMRFTLLDTLRRPTQRPILAIRQHLLPTAILLFLEVHLVRASELAAFTASVRDLHQTVCVAS